MKILSVLLVITELLVKYFHSIFITYVIIYSPSFRAIILQCSTEERKSGLDWYDGEQMLNSGWTIPLLNSHGNILNRKQNVNEKINISP